MDLLLRNETLGVNSSLYKSTVCPPQCPAILLTGFSAAMARTMLQFTRPTFPTCPARLLSIILTLRLPGPAASPVVCRLTTPPLYCFCYQVSLYTFLSMLLRDLGLSVVLAAVLM